jgi:hypothetical protein
MRLMHFSSAGGRRMAGLAVLTDQRICRFDGGVPLDGQAHARPASIQSAGFRPRRLRWPDRLVEAGNLQHSQVVEPAACNLQADGQATL